MSSRALVIPIRIPDKKGITTSQEIAFLRLDYSMYIATPLQNE